MLGIIKWFVCATLCVSLEGATRKHGGMVTYVCMPDQAAHELHVGRLSDIQFTSVFMYCIFCISVHVHLQVPQPGSFYAFGAGYSGYGSASMHPGGYYPPVPHGPGWHPGGPACSVPTMQFNPVRWMLEWRSCSVISNIDLYSISIYRWNTH